jgi:SAM-dependent methyltransferase
MKSDPKLDSLCTSFNDSFQVEKKGYSLAQVLPRELLSDPNYSYFKRCESHSGTPDIMEYFDPLEGKNYLDFGCNTNLQRYQLYRYPWNYYGIEACPEIVLQVQNFIQRKDIKNAHIIHSNSLSVSFSDSFFDDLTCIGVFEYYVQEKVLILFSELSRVLKNEGKMIVDIPNIEHHAFPLLCRMEEFFNRPVACQIAGTDFLKMLPIGITCEAIDCSQVMLRYYLRKK